MHPDCEAVGVFFVLQILGNKVPGRHQQVDGYLEQ
jgi:hypothetical protein